MKTTKILIALLLVLVTSTTFAQANKGLFVTVKYSHEMNRVETWVSHINDRISHNSYDKADLPVISQTYYSDFTPFEEAFFEDGLFMEPWMSHPFKDDSLQEELCLEYWMSIPFETEELIQVEEWMTISNW